MKTKMKRSIKKPVLFFSGVIAMGLAIGAIWVSEKTGEDTPEDRLAPLRLSKSTDPATSGRSYSMVLPIDASEAGDGGGLWKAFAEALRVERVTPQEDTRLKERSVAKEAFYEMRGIVQELSEQGLKGEALYEEAERRLSEANAEGGLKMLEGYRQLEEDLANADLDSMGPEDRFEYLVKARREAFGEEKAEQLFFENEAYTRYKLEEKAIAQDTDLSMDEKRSEIVGRRNALQVELASRGSYVSFADERREELDRRLRETYGDSAVEAMSDEERTAAIWELYRQELPPEMLAKAEKVLAAEEQKRAAFETHRQETEAILSDEQLSFEQKQQLLEELSTDYNAGGQGKEL